MTTGFLFAKIGGVSLNGMMVGGSVGVRHIIEAVFVVEGNRKIKTILSEEALRGLLELVDEKHAKMKINLRLQSLKHKRCVVHLTEAPQYRGEPATIAVAAVFPAECFRTTGKKS